MKFEQLWREKRSCKESEGVESFAVARGRSNGGRRVGRRGLLQRAVTTLRGQVRDMVSMRSDILCASFYEA